MIVTVGEVREDAGHERLEARAPPVLTRIDLAVRHDHPSEVAGCAGLPDDHLRIAHASLQLTQSFQ
jgi:hypothetical protein